MRHVDPKKRLGALQSLLKEGHINHSDAHVYHAFRIEDDLTRQLAFKGRYGEGRIDQILSEIDSLIEKVLEKEEEDVDEEARRSA